MELICQMKTKLNNWIRRENELIAEYDAQQKSRAFIKRFTFVFCVYVARILRTNERSI